MLRMASSQLQVYEDKLKQRANGDDTLFDSFVTEQVHGNDELNISTIENSAIPAEIHLSGGT